jgi:hypothetical protein
MKDIMTNITLPEKEDRILKIRAAEAGTSKRKLATQITREWLQEQDIKARISDMLNQISQMPDNERLFKAVEDLVDGSIKLTECRVQKSVNEMFGKEYIANDTEEMGQKIKKSLDVLREVFVIPDIDPDMLSAAVIESYFKQRVR